MYRLLKMRCASNMYGNSFQSNCQTSTKVCSFCTFSHPKIIRKVTINYLQHRLQTTTINTALLDKPKLKKIKRKYKRYGELLEVSDNKTSNRMASIRNLNASQLSMLVEQPDITLDQLHKFKTQLNQINTRNIKQYEGDEEANDFFLLEKVQVTELPDNKTTEVDTDDDSLIIEDLQASGISDQAGLIKNSSLLETLKEHVQKDEAEEEANENLAKTSYSKKSAKFLKSERLKMEAEAKENDKKLVLKGKEEHLARLLYAYVNVCLSCGMTAKAYNALMYYRRNSIKYPNATRVRNVEIHNLLLHSYAMSPNMPKIKELWGILKEDSIKPSLQTYAAVLESVGRLRKPEKENEFLEAIRLDIEENGVSFNDIIKIPNYRNDQRKHTIKAIKILQPDFQIGFPAEVPDYSYDCHLLKHIDYTESRVKTGPAKNLFTVSELHEKFSGQVDLEVKGDVTVKSIEQIDESSCTVSVCRKIVSDLEESWTKIVMMAFERNLLYLKNRESMSYGLTLYPYLCVLNKEEYVKAIIRDIRLVANGSETFSPTLSFLYRALGTWINERYEISEKQRCGIMEGVEDVYLKYADWYLNRDNAINSRIAWQNFAQEAEKIGPSLDAGNWQWPYPVRMSVGKFLYNIILKDIKLDINCISPRSKRKHYLPAFYTIFRYEGKRLKEEIKPHPILSKIYRESKPETLTFRTFLLPMICPPKPWLNIHNGGYILGKSDLIRLPESMLQQWQILESISPKKIWPVLDSLNQLSSIPWVVNTSVLDVAIQVFRDGGSVKLNVPQPPSILPAVPLLQPDADKTERINVAKIRVDLKRRKREMYSLWCDSLYRLSLANYFRDKTFWLPHNMDFRGRVYPIPPHLNHLGSDLGRSLLVFAQGKPLGPNGLDWLKIHTINLTGLKKRNTKSDRLKYANDNLDKILDSAENPLNGEMWWAASDEPWQTLAACMEISKALKSENPEKYICQFPVHQDGSCNGLQHYAALGRDQIGAESVNLHPFDEPQDVYSNVVAMVNEIIEKEVAANIEMAIILKGFVKRKVIKQTVMTTVYGVTKFGARLQIARQLKDIDGFPQEHVWAASIYLVQKTFLSLRTMFESAREIQDWFTECARVISMSSGKKVEWVTPLGFPVVQPYTKLDKLNNKHAIDYIGRPNTVKQKNAFPPNFIHSLDSSHMMLTSLHCENEDLTFMSVHDCYWTHPSTVEIMNKICREQFVALHSEPILEDLAKFLLEKYGYGGSQLNCNDSLEDAIKKKVTDTFISVPNKGTFNLKGVLKSVYFFS